MNLVLICLMIASSETIYESDEDEDEESDNDNGAVVPKASLTIDKIGLNNCTKTRVGNTAVFNKAVRVKNEIKICLPEPGVEILNPTTNNGTLSPVLQNIINSINYPNQNPVTEECGTPNTSNHDVISENERLIEDDTERKASIFENKYCRIFIKILTLFIILSSVTGALIYALCSPNQKTDIDNLPQNFTLRFVTRGKWFAMEPKRTVMPPFNFKPVPFIVVSHTATNNCFNPSTCRNQIRSIQGSQMRDIFDDIAYNFLVAGDGYIYEGRGWDEASAGTTPMDCSALAVAFVGNFVNEVPPLRQLNAFKLILEEGIKIGKLDKDIKMFMQKQIKSTESPGEALIVILIHSPHWSPFNKKYLVCNNNTKTTT